MAWKGGGITGTLGANSHDLRFVVPVPDPDLARVRVRIWAEQGPGVPGRVFLDSASAGPVAAVAPVALSRAASAALDVTADVNTADADAGPYVAVRIRAQDDFNVLESVHVDMLERGFGTYPGAGSTLPAGVTSSIVGGSGFVPVDDDEVGQDDPLSADLLFDVRSNLAELAGRRQVRGCWGDWVNTVPNPDVYRTNGGLAPQRIPVMLPIPQQGEMKLTLAANIFDAPPSARKVWLCTFNQGGGIDDVVAEWSISALGDNVSTVNIPTQRVKRRYDKRCPPLGLDAYLSAALIVEGAIPQRDRLRLEGIRTDVADDDIINGGWGLSSLVLWGP